MINQVGDLVVDAEFFSCRTFSLNTSALSLSSFFLCAGGRACCLFPLPSRLLNFLIILSLNLEISCFTRIVNIQVEGKYETERGHHLLSTYLTGRTVDSRTG